MGPEARAIELPKVNLLPPGSALEGRLRKRFAVTETVVEAGGRDLRVLHPADIDGLIQRSKEEDDLPFWAFLWPASISLAKYLAGMGDAEFPPESGRSDALPVRALEIGVGVGLAGMAAALRGWEVYQTDLIPDALKFARINALRNDLEIPGFVADWRSFGVRGRFDVLMGSDVLYEPTLHPALKRIVNTHLAPGGRVLISDPCRVYSLQFMARLEDDGWAVKVTDAPPVPGSGVSVLLYEATPPNATV